MAQECRPLLSKKINFFYKNVLFSQSCLNGLLKRVSLIWLISRFHCRILSREYCNRVVVIRCAGCASAHPIVVSFLCNDPSFGPKSLMFMLICPPNVCRLPLTLCNHFERNFEIEKQKYIKKSENRQSVNSKSACKQSELACS